MQKEDKRKKKAINRSKRMSKFRDATGYSLLEILTVVAILAMLFALTMGIYGRIMTYLKESETKAQLKTLDQYLMQYKRDHGHFPYLKDGDEVVVGQYMNTPCAGLGQEANGDELNREILVVLNAENFHIPSAWIRNKQIVDAFGSPLVFRFLVGSGTGLGVVNREERVFIWSYGKDKKNHTKATNTYSNRAEPDFDDAELQLIRSQDNDEDIRNWGS